MRRETNEQLRWWWRCPMRRGWPPAHRCTQPSRGWP